MTLVLGREAVYSTHYSIAWLGNVSTSHQRTSQLVPAPPGAALVMDYSSRTNLWNVMMLAQACEVRIEFSNSFTVRLQSHFLGLLRSTFCLNLIMLAFCCCAPVYLFRILWESLPLKSF